MLARFWGTRGSLPTAQTAGQVRDKMIAALQAAEGIDLSSRQAVADFVDHELPFQIAGGFGGNTSCVEIDGIGEEYLICDMGSGARELGNRIQTGDQPDKQPVFHILMSHCHWDHIMGFPFFTPAYVPGNKVTIYGCHEELEQVFRLQHSRPYFPVDFEDLGADIEFVTLRPDEPREIAGVRVTGQLQHHESNSYAYRLEHGGKTVIYATDGEHRIEVEAEVDAVASFYRNADLLIFDAMYSLADAVTIRADWGHSSNLVAVELARRAGVSHLCLFHHEPSNDDKTLAGILRDSLRYLELTDPDNNLIISTAYDGLEIKV
jgi:phosphoribosyl 1,2-cyclic phosphodiesterase